MPGIESSSIPSGSVSVILISSEYNGITVDAFVTLIPYLKRISFNASTVAL